MKSIGGFYELVLPNRSFDYHEDAIALSNGRACLRALLQQLTISKCYVPNYTCDAVYDSFDEENVPYELYTLAESMEPSELPTLEPDEYFYYINYFGTCNHIVAKLYKVYGNRLIIDNTHDFFKKQQFDCWSYTSARKYFGVPDGAFLYAPEPVTVTAPRFNAYSLTHSVERLKGNQKLAFQSFQVYEKSLTTDINTISVVSEKLLSLIDIEHVRARRKANFQTLDTLLHGHNTFSATSLAADDTPFAYPFLPAKTLDKKALHANNIFVPTLWADPLKRDITTAFERTLAENLMPLPLDERYTASDMEFIASRILKVLKTPEVTT